MTSEPFSIWLDVTRLVSRTGRGPFTGIDRVELAYLRGLLAREGALHGFARTATGYVVVDRAGLAELLERIDGRRCWGAVDALGALSRRLTPERRRAEADLRRLAVAKCLRPSLSRMLSHHLLPGTWLLNVGHSNLSEGVLGAFTSNAGRVAVMVHDTIPLDLRGCHRPGMPESFARRINAVTRHAELVLSPSASTAEAFHRRYPAARYPVAVAPGMDRPNPDEGALRDYIVPETPYFVTVGTIDPRKNQSFLIDLWSRLGTEPPTLYLAGSRGWCPPELIDRLANLPKGVIEVGGLPDTALAALIQGAAGLLHPSLAEGYGFPLLEAACLGVPVVAGDLAVYRETLGDGGVYLTTDDSYPWIEAITTLADRYRKGEQNRGRRQDGPTWDAHINYALSLL